MSINQLYISSMSPDNGAKCVNLNSNIKIVFNRALNKSTILKNIIVIEDPTGTIENINDIATKPYTVIQGTVKCEESTVEFNPKEELLAGTKYIVYIRKHISSVYGDILLQDKLYSFNTDDDVYEGIVGIDCVKYVPPVIKYPECNSIINKLNAIDLSIDTNDYGIYVQISNNNDFNNIVFEYKSDKDVASVYINTKLPDDNYYIRAKSINSEWCDNIQIYLQSLEECPVNINDLYYSDDISNALESLDEETDDSIKYTVYPSGRINNTVSNILIEFNKILDIRHIQDVYLTRIFDNAIYEDVYEEIDINSYSICHDSELDKTYLVLHLGK